MLDTEFTRGRPATLGSACYIATALLIATALAYGCLKSLGSRHVSSFDSIHANEDSNFTPAVPSFFPLDAVSPSLGPKRSSARIAFLLMLPDRLLHQWATILGAMDTKADIEAFFFMWQHPPSPDAVEYARNASRGVLNAAWHVPKTSWAAGRNALAQAAYTAEVERGARFRYWVFFDEEVLACKGCPTVDVDAALSAACCLDYIVRGALLAPYGYAVYAININWNDSPMSPELSRTFSEWDCPDAKLAAIHRDAAPVLLPYATHFDDVNWYMAQGVLNTINSGCIPTGTAVFVRDILDTGSAHAEYPKTRLDDAVLPAYLGEAFPSLIASGGPLNRSSSQTVFCKGPGRTHTFPEWDREAMVTDVTREALRQEWVATGVLRRDWRTAPEFRTCLKHLQPHFDAHVARGVTPAPRHGVD